MIITAVETSKIEPGDMLPPIAEWIQECLKKQHLEPQEGDILVLSSKIVSYFEGNIISLQDISLEELVEREADVVIVQTPWVALTKKNGIYSANAGIDLSNVPKGMAIVWPKDPFQSASSIRSELMQRCSLKK